jgi:nucleoside 2-deoxyribosyltransferase
MLMSEQQLTACISGSFKFKPEIDALHEEFADYGVTVLEPTKGWLYVPTQRLIKPDQFRPLPSEVGMDAFEVEERFLAAVRRADLLYLYNKYQYIGNMAAYEIGFASALKKPVFAAESFSAENFEYEIGKLILWQSKVTVATVAEAVQAVRETKD